MKVYTIFFSPTGTTKKIVEYIGENLATRLNTEICKLDFAVKTARDITYTFNKSDLLVIGVPTYAGRVPNILLDFLTKNISSNGAFVIPIVLFGNRNYDESLTELAMIMSKNNFINLGGGAFVGEHSFSNILGKDRPNEQDFLLASNFCDKIYTRFFKTPTENCMPVDINYQIKPYYTPRDRYGKGVNILKVKPKTHDNCDNCKICANICPMGSISFENPHEIIGICIKCCACEKKCPKHAKYFDDFNYLYHKTELEEQFIVPSKSQIF